MWATSLKTDSTFLVSGSEVTSRGLWMAQGPLFTQQLLVELCYRYGGFEQGRKGPALMGLEFHWEEADRNKETNIKTL